MERIEILQRVVQYLNKEETSAIIDYLKKKDFSVHREALGMVMSEVIDSFNSPFFLGEILVCEAEVEYKKNRGYGMSIGNNNEHAIIMAAADSAFNLNDSLFFTDLNQYMASAYKRMQESESLEKQIIRSTKVEFGLMVEG